MRFKIKKSDYEYDIVTNNLYYKESNSLLEHDQKGLYRININGCLVKKDIDWFKHLAILGLVLPYPFEKEYNNIIFKPITITKQSNNYNFTPVFIKPLELTINNKVFRLIPRYPDHLISSDGIVINSSNYNVNRVWFSDQYRYNYVTIKDRYLLSHTSSISVHRLLALAWIENDDYVIKCVVDHIDNNSVNNNLSNLHWVSLSENNKKAVTDQKIPIELRNITTHEVFEFSSVGEASRFLGKSIGNTFSPLVMRPGRVWETTHGAYEMRIKDSKPWYYQSKEIYSKKNIMLNLNGDITYYLNWKEIPIYFSLNPDDFDTPQDLINTLQKKYKYVEIKRLNGGRLGTEQKQYEIKNIITKEILECKSVKDIAKAIGGKSIESAIYNRIITGNDNKPYRGWLVRIKSDLLWADDNGNINEITNKAKPIILIDEFNQEHIFMSKKAFGRKFNMTNHQINRYINSKRILIHNNRRYTLKDGPA